jgi:hypothetical protein
MDAIRHLWALYHVPSSTARILITALTGVLCALALWRFRSRPLPFLLGSFVVCAFAARFLHDAPLILETARFEVPWPEVPAALFWRAADFFALVALSTAWGKLLVKSPRLPGLALSAGLSVAALLTLALTCLEAQGWLSRSSELVHGATLAVASALALLAFARVRKKAPSPNRAGDRARPWQLEPVELLLLALALSPLLVNLLLPCAPDADMHTNAEILGYLAQGKSLGQAASGLPGELLSFRYPAAFAAMGLLWSWLLHLTGSEALLLLWAVSYVALLLSILSLARALKLNPFFSLLFMLGHTITASQGLSGSQSAKMLAYGLGIQALATLASGRNAGLALLLLAATTVIQPVVALPFALALGLGLLVHYRRELLTPGGALGLVTFAGALGYLYATTTGASLPSQPGILLRELTPRLFVKNILRWGWYDLKIQVLLLILPALYFARTRILDRPALLLLNLWLLGELLIDGFFGDTHWAIRFHAGFGQIGPFAVSVALLIQWILLTHPKHERRVAIALTLIWCAVFAPTFTPGPYWALSTRTDVQLGAWMRDHLAPDAFVANPSFDDADYYYSWALRGNSFRDTAIGRITDHQIKAPTLRSRVPFYECVKQPARAEVFACLRGLGATHLFSTSHGASAERVAKLGPPLHRIGDSAIYELP